MLYIGLLKSKRAAIYREFDTFEEAWGWLRTQNKQYVVEALVLEETEYLDDQYPDFDSCKVVASMRLIQ